MPDSWRTFLLAIALGLFAVVPNVAGQSIAIGPPSFQSNDFPSLETTILDRLALGGSFNPEDLGTLAHLAVLESIAMLADVQYDMPNTVLGARLETQIRQLWDSAATFEEGVSSGPVGAKTLIDAQPLYASMQGNLQSIESTMGVSASVSNRAAAHLGDITRLTAAASTLMRAMESDFLDRMPLLDRPTSVPDSLGNQVRLLGNNIVTVIQNVKVSKHETSGWSAVTQDLDALFELVQILQKTLSSQPSTNDIEIALRAVRGRMWRVEARITRLGWPRDLERQWRGVREQLNLISDQLGLPRVIDRPPAAAAAAVASQPPAAGTSSQPVARIYRGPP